VIWLKRDVRLHDHGAFHHAMTSNTANAVCILYLYEPDQLTEPTVHGSHIALINEGLIDLDRQLQGTASTNNNPKQSEHTSTKTAALSKYEFQSLTVCYGNAVATLQYIHSQCSIDRLLCHEETGHFASYQRDRKVRKWCRQNGVTILELNQTGVTRRLKDRDDFARKLEHFLSQLEYPLVNLQELRPRIRQLEIDTAVNTTDFVPPKQSQQCVQTTNVPLLDELQEIPKEQRTDRKSRQQGGELLALKTLRSFLQDRSQLYQKGISSPLSSWTSCSRLSVFLSWGHLSLRTIYQATRRRQIELQALSNTGEWRKSLGAFMSRIHWRSHFIQKLESDPLIEKRDLHPSFQPLRRQPNDWNEAYYQAWATGRTGFPFVDACMRCLLHTGWINFRMRAMLVSFATHNLWLDWKRIAPHLARVFCDYEPGIHYPQLQMQAGTTGINAMRVYNVIKQGQDQDPEGVFVKRYVPELGSVPKKFIHEPWKMKKGQQQLCFADDSIEADGSINTYPERIVDAQETARTAKAKLHAIRQQETTEELAQQVYQKHGSRTRRDSERPKKRVLPKAAPSMDQPRISSFLVKDSGKQSTNTKSIAGIAYAKRPVEVLSGDVSRRLPNKKLMESRPIVMAFQAKVGTNVGSWACQTCTFFNDKPHGLVCSMCNSSRRS